MPLPLLLTKSSRPIFNLIILLISTVLCILSIKRGAIIAVSIVWIVYFYNTLKTSKSTFFIILAVLFVGTSFLSEKIQITDLAESALRMQDRLFAIGEDGGSGRVDIIDTFFENDFDDLISFPEIFIGNGFEGTYYKYGDLSSMHNDFLEVLYTLGLGGLILLSFFYYCMFRRVNTIIKCKHVLFTPYLSVSLLFIIFSLIGSNFNYFYLSAPLFITIGTLEAVYNKKYNVV